MKFRSLRLCGEEEAATATAVIVVVAAEVEVVVVVRWLPVQSSVVDPVVDVGGPAWVGQGLSQCAPR